MAGGGLEQPVRAAAVASTTAAARVESFMMPRGVGHGRLATSPPDRVDRPWYSGRLLTSPLETYRTDPSQNRKLAPLVWPLPKAETRGSVWAKPVGLPTGS